MDCYICSVGASIGNVLVVSDLNDEAFVEKNSTNKKDALLLLLVWFGTVITGISVGMIFV